MWIGREIWLGRELRDGVSMPAWMRREGKAASQGFRCKIHGGTIPLPDQVRIYTLSWAIHHAGTQQRLRGYRSATAPNMFKA